jgi:septal ring factor EnvC (AmiA/AmiB activator)
MATTAYRYWSAAFQHLTRRGTGLRLVMTLLATAPMWCPAGAPPGVAAPGELDQRLKEERQELKGLKEQIKGYKSRLNQSKRQERNVLQTLDDSERLLQQKRRELQVNERNLKLQADKHALLVRQMDELTQQVQARQEYLQARLRALYKQGRAAYLPFLLSASDVTDFFMRVHFTVRLVEYDADLLHEHRQNLDALERTRRSVKARADQLQKARAQVTAKQGEIEQEQGRKNQLLTKIRDEQGSYESAVRELEESSKRLMGLISKLERERKRALALQAQAERRRQQQARAAPTRGTPTPPAQRFLDTESKFAKLRGQLPWPIAGRLVSTYGKIKHPTFNTYTFNKGISISAQPGSDFRVIDAGQVLYADQFKGYGTLLIVDHGDSYYSLYAHASELTVRVGDRVTRNQVVGKTGEGGALNGPALYFEIRHQGKPENPLEWLANNRP